MIPPCLTAYDKRAAGNNVKMVSRLFLLYVELYPVWRLHAAKD